MKIAKWLMVGALAAAICTIDNLAAAKSGAAIFINNSSYLTAYPIGSNGDVSPIAVNTDMIHPGAIARDANGKIYVANPLINTIDVFPSNASGNVPPLATIGGSRSGLANPAGIAVDRSGNIYVANGATSAITIYPPIGDSTGVLNEAPSATIAGRKTLLDFPLAMALDASGNIYVSNEYARGAKGAGRYEPQITVYRAGSTGNVAPMSAISGADTGLAFPLAIAVDSNARIYVTNVDPQAILVFPAHATGDVAPIATITGSNTGIGGLLALALDSAGDIYAGNVGDTGASSVNIYAAGSNGNVAPVATITGADTGLAGFGQGLTLDSSGNLYVANNGGGPYSIGSVTVYAAGSSGDAAPIQAITSSFEGIYQSSAIAVDSSGAIYVANGDDPFSPTIGSISIFSPGSYGLDAPAAVIAGPDTNIQLPYRVAVDGKGNISVLNEGNTITVYPAGSSGDASPINTISIDSSGTLFATGIARSAGGALYVSNQGVSECGNRGCRMSLGNVAIYSPRATGNANPSAIIAGPTTKLASPSAVAVDRSGNIYVANQGPPVCSGSCGCYPNGEGSVTVYAPGSAGDAKPIATISGSQTGLISPSGISVDANDNIYVLNGGGFGFLCADDNVGLLPGHLDFGAYQIFDPILVFTPHSNGNAAPIAHIGGHFTGLGGISGIAVGPAN